MTDRSAAIQAAMRRKHAESCRRSRERRAGLLPPLPTCSRCGAKCHTDRWLPLCSTCARKCCHDHSDCNARRASMHQARPLRLAAEQILDELRAEARADARR